MPFSCWADYLQFSERIKSRHRLSLNEKQRGFLNPLIFDWIYQRLRNRQEEQMNRSATELVEEARTRLLGN